MNSKVQTRTQTPVVATCIPSLSLWWSMGCTVHFDGLLSLKISRVIGILRKLKRTFPQYILRTIYNSLIHPHLIYGLNLWGFKHKRITVLQKKAVRILTFRPYISHTTSAFKELKMLMLEDLYKIQLYKIYYKNVKNFLPEYFQTFTPYYSTATDHNHDLRHTTLRLPMTKREYYVQCTKYQYLKLIRETSQLDLDRCLTSTITQFIAHFKYTIMQHTTQCATKETAMSANDYSKGSIFYDNILVCILIFYHCCTS